MVPPLFRNPCYRATGVWPFHVGRARHKGWPLRCAAAGNRLSGLEPKFQLPAMSELPSGLPEGAEIASTGGFNRHIGPLYRLPDAEGAAARFAFIAAEKHMNSAGSVHGGMLMSFVDVAMSRTSRLVSGAPRCSTVSLTADFVGPARLGELIEARTKVTRRSRSLVFLTAEITAGDRAILIAQGLWKIAGET